RLIETLYLPGGTPAPLGPGTVKEPSGLTVAPYVCLLSPSLAVKARLSFPAWGGVNGCPLLTIFPSTLTPRGPQPRNKTAAQAATRTRRRHVKPRLMLSSPLVNERLARGKETSERLFSPGRRRAAGRG